MRKAFQRMLSLALALVLAAGLSTAALADFQYPNEVWPLLDEWTASFSAKDPDRIIAVVQKLYDLLMPYGYNNQVCENLEPKCGIASWCCEMKGDLNGAVTWLERQREMDEWMNQNGYDKKDVILDSAWRLRYLKTAASPKIYALRQNVNSPYGYGPATGVWYGSVHEGSQTGESAVLAYIDFINGQSASDASYWINNYMAYSPKFAAAALGGVIEVAWNFPNLQAVLSAPDTQIASAAAALGGMNCTILLRLGAEMNDGYGVDPAQFIQAFQRIANAAHQYPNIKTVFSPNNVSRRDMTFESFYPGDQYVDWIGVSNYHNTNYATPNSQGPGDYSFDNWERCNAQGYYGEGVYDSDPLVILQPLAEFAKAHNKPMMISEGGYGYHTADDASQNAYAVDQVHKFYSYVCMIYPQIKAVFYFDQNVAGDSHNYLLAGNSAIDNAYRAAIAGNGAYLAQGQTSGSNWVELGQAGAVSGTVRLGTYASFPGKDPTSVTYYVDGQQVSSVGRAPFYFDLDASTLTPGKHTVRAEAASGRFHSATATYELNVAGAPAAPAQPAGMTAAPTASAVLVNGQKTSFDAYNIGGANFFKLRDLAYVLSGTPKQFEVSWDGAANCISLISGQTYTPVGNEMASAGGGEQAAAPTTSKILKDGQEISLTAFNINGANYFKLRDIGAAFDFGVDWDQATQTISISTSKGYTAG